MSVKSTVPTIRSETHGNVPKVLHSIEVKVKEATSKGYSVARGGAGCSQLSAAEQQNKKRESWGRYGKYVRHIMQSRDICADLRGTDSICRMVSQKTVLYSNPQVDSERVFPASGMVG